MVIDLSVRRIFCDNPECSRSSFAEQVPGLTARYGRRTPGLQRVLEKIALAPAGRAGVRLALVLGTVVSRVTLISQLMRLPDPVLTVAPRVLGVDDFALKRSERYGTILIDIEAGRPVDLLPDREGESFAAWLRAHPGAQVICRDRASAYAQAARAAAPQALQVADRYHLWANLGDHVEKEVARHRACLPEPAPDDASCDDDGQGAARAEQIADATAAVRQAKYARIPRTRERYQAVHGLLAQGHSRHVIARRLNLAYNTVRRYAKAASQEEPLATGYQHKSSILDPYKPYLHERLARQKVGDVALFREIRAQGYPGKSGTVSAYLRELRTTGVTPPLAPTPPTVREVAKWILTPPENLDEADQVRLKSVLARCPELTAATGHLRGFARMPTELRGGELKNWLAGIYTDTPPSLHAFANGIDRDRDAVIAGLTLPYSSGAVEGHVNRVKYLKRQTFGRARFALLRKRVLLA